MIAVYDVGSLPFWGDFRKFLEGAAAYAHSSSQDFDSAKYFEGNVLGGFLDKVRAGVDIPNYPQFRDMSEMFLESMKDVEKVKGGYVESGILSLRMERAQIPEVTVIEGNAREIHEETGRPFKVKVCVTGPYTLSCLFIYRDSQIFGRLGEIVSQIVENNIFDGKHGGVSLVAVDEPTFGLLDDPMLDYGAEGRENLRRAWESIFHKASSRGVRTCLHLHSTVDGLFWDVESLNVVESHVEDSIYRLDRTKKSLESTDKFLKASICVSDFDKLIREGITAHLQKTDELTINERVAETWKKIFSGELNPAIFLENVELMKKRLTQIVNRFGGERVPYAGPECGLKSFPAYGCALEYLRRSANAVKKHS